MEYRNITVVDSASNNKIVVNTNATTFGELKQAVIAAGVNITGKDWIEGITKTIPTEDNSQLPQNVKYKGETTNNLVYLLTNTSKNIESGVLSRKECYDFIKNNSLSNDIKKQTGKNYTNLSTDSLNSLIEGVVSINKEGKKLQEESEIETKYDNVINAVAALLVFIQSSPKVIKDLEEAIDKTSIEVTSLPKDVKFSSEDIENMFK